MCIPFRFAIKEHSSTSVGWKSLKPCVPRAAPRFVSASVWVYGNSMRCVRVCGHLCMHVCMHVFGLKGLSSRAHDFIFPTRLISSRVRAHQQPSWFPLACLPYINAHGEHSRVYVYFICAYTCACMHNALASGAPMRFRISISGPGKTERGNTHNHIIIALFSGHTHTYTYFSNT